MIKSIIEGGDISDAERMLKIFFGPSLQRRNSFFKIIDAEILIKFCKKSLFARATTHAIPSVKQFRQHEAV